MTLGLVAGVAANLADDHNTVRWTWLTVTAAGLTVSAWSTLATVCRKTGTLTRGRPVVSDVISAGQIGADELLRLAASLNQVSPHVLAGPIVAAAHQRGLTLNLPDQVCEQHGYGVEGQVEGRRVRLGKASWIVADPQPAWARRVRRRATLDGSLTVFVAVDDRPAGAFLLQDPIRSDAPRMIRALRRAGITRTVLVTGDRADTAETVARITGIDAVHAEQDPAQKLAIITAEGRDHPTIMVGDGINDAPALAAAGVGVALASRGATASSEAVVWDTPTFPQGVFAGTDQ